MDDEIGSRVGDYEVIAVLGAGGMGCVYKVRNVISDRVEAMKVLLPNLEGDPELADRFMREIKVQASLDHPNIAALHTALRIDNQLLMLMEYVEGTTIETLLQSGPLPLEQAVDYIAQVLSALSYAHARGPPSIGAFGGIGYGPRSDSPAYWKRTGTRRVCLETTTNGIPLGAPL